jgi:hypothetical protein
MYIANAFSLSMLPEWVAKGQVRFQRLTLEEARNYVASWDYTSAVGHADVAEIFSQQLGVEIIANRIKASFVPGITEEILVGQYTGPRLPEGATTLPEGAEIQWVMVTFTENDIEEFAPYADEEGE